MAAASHNLRQDLHHIILFDATGTTHQHFSALLDTESFLQVKSSLNAHDMQQTRAQRSGLGGNTPTPLGLLGTSFENLFVMVLICASQLHLLLFSVGDRLPDVVVLLFVCLLNRCNIFSVIRSLACLHCAVSVEPCPLPPHSRQVSGSRPSPATHRLASSPWSSWGCIWEVLLTTLVTLFVPQFTFFLGGGHT